MKLAQIIIYAMLPYVIEKANKGCERALKKNIEILWIKKKALAF